jgi:rhamnosyltransferase
MKKAKISVAMATYNGERFLQEQLDSLARQTLLPYELVACDDGSRDGTLDILHRFAAEAPFRVRIYRNPERLGYCDNFLHAVGLCEGDLVAFCDQDDIWLPSKLARCAEKFRSECVAMVIHLATLADTNLQPLGRTWPHLGRFGRLRREVPTLHYMDVAGMTMVFRRDATEPLSEGGELQRSLSKLLLGHDQVMRLLAAARGTVIPIREVLAVHRCHDRNTSRAHVTTSATAPAYVLGAQGLRGRLAAALHWFQTHAALSREARWQDYAREGHSLSSKANALGRAARHAEGRLRAMLERSSRVLSRRAEAFGERSALYQDVPGRARTQFFRMVVGGRYGRRNRGGLGPWSLAKDCLVALRFSRWQFPILPPGKPGGRADPVGRGKQLIDASVKRGGY